MWATLESTDGLSITIVQPTNGASFTGPTNIGLIAGVAASNDTAAIVEFFDNSQPIGVSSNWRLWIRLVPLVCRPEATLISSIGPISLWGAMSLPQARRTRMETRFGPTQ